MDRHADPTTLQPLTQTPLDAPAPDSIPVPPGDPADLRRKRRRAFADRLLALSIYLPDHDRTLIEASYRDSLRVVELASLIHGQSPTDTQIRAMRRRIRVLVRRLLNPRFEFVLRALVNAEGIARAPWSPLRARVAREFFLEGRPMRAIASGARVSFYLIRRHRDAVEGLFDMHTKRSRANARNLA